MAIKVNHLWQAYNINDGEYYYYHQSLLFINTVQWRDKSEIFIYHHLLFPYIIIIIFSSLGRIKSSPSLFHLICFLQICKKAHHKSGQKKNIFTNRFKRDVFDRILGKGFKLNYSWYFCLPQSEGTYLTTTSAFFIYSHPWIKGISHGY